MAEIERLVETSELKFDQFIRLIDEGFQSAHLFYDTEFDALMVLFVPPEIETVVHYTSDKNIAYLYRPDTMEVVGIQVEAFRKSFVPKHAALRAQWELAERTKPVSDYGDVLNMYFERKPTITREIAREVDSKFQGGRSRDLVPA